MNSDSDRLQTALAIHDQARVNLDLHHPGTGIIPVKTQPVGQRRVPVQHPIRQALELSQSYLALNPLPAFRKAR